MLDITILESLDVSPVVAAFPVGFCLLTHGTTQYIAYYDADHHMTVASRSLGSDTWITRRLPTDIGWDSHNYVVMAMDDDGHLHLSGNMHCVPLIYFRTREAGDISTLEQVAHMTGEAEDRCTYPAFMRSADGRLIFHYRDGGSGNGSEIYNVYDHAARTWSRLLDTTLTDGHGLMNAYMSGPAPGPDGMFHMAWVWRDTPDCSTNHDVSYARTRDLLNWESVDGTPVELPIALDTPGMIVDPLPVGSGMINGSQRVGFDRKHRAIVTYHKHDAQGNTQMHAARFDDGQWVSRVITDWNYRWHFEGGGSMIHEIRPGAIAPHTEGTLALPYQHNRFGEGVVVVDENTLEHIRYEPPVLPYPAELNQVESDFPRMETRWAQDIGTAPDNGSRYMLRWESLPSNRDSKPEGDHPAPAMLRLYRMSKG